MKQKLPEVNIEPQFKIAAGLDIHKDTIFCYVANLNTNTSEETQWPTYTENLKELALYLKSHNIECALMESTGVYWISLYHILREEGLDVIVANPQHIKGIPKRKTDKKDAKWLCTLVINRFVRRSFIPEDTQFQIRELCRMNENFIRSVTQSTNRIVKILERANIKLNSVASRIKTKTCQNIIDALVDGEKDPEVLANLAKGSLRTKKEEIKKAVVGRLTDADIINLKLHNADVLHATNQIAIIEGQIQKSLKEDYLQNIEILDSISGIGEKLSIKIISEIGTDMTKFESADHLTSWAGLSPGNNESAGVRKNTATRKGNKVVRTAMITAAWGAVKVKNSYWSYLFAYMERRMPKKKAITAIARKLLKLAYKLLVEKRKYEEGGKKLFDKVFMKRTNSSNVSWASGS